MQQINEALKDSGLYGGESLTSKEFAYNARLAAKKIRDAVNSFGKRTASWRWGIMIACSLEGYAEELDRGASGDAEGNAHLPRE